MIPRTNHILKISMGNYKTGISSNGKKTSTYKYQQENVQTTTQLPQENV